jgi:hypothetical protein
MGEGRKLHNEELRDLYPMPSIVEMIKSGRMISVRHVAQMEAEEHVYVISWKDGRKETTRKT